MVDSKRPNIVFLFADDWGRYASAYRRFEGSDSINQVIETPNFDRIATEGAIFTNAHVPAPSCTPCRSSILSGTYFWETGLGAILDGAYWDDSIPTYPLMLEEKGYHIGYTYKVWSPGKSENAPYGGQRTKYEPLGNKWKRFSQEVTQRIPEMGVDSAKQVLFDETRESIKAFLDDKSEDQPFCYWWGPVNTHREWQRGSGKKLWGLDPDDLKGRMPDFLPDVHDVREDFNDYLGEVLAVDYGVGIILDELEKAGELDNTLVVISGDHGIPGVPRSKCNLYDIGTQVTMAARWPGKIKPGKVVNEFVNLMRLGPTFLEAAGEDPLENMVDSIMPLLTSENEGNDDSGYVVTGRERHVMYARTGGLPYPCRSIRDKDYLYIYNFAPDRWPAGNPHGFDSYDSSNDDPEMVIELVNSSYDRSLSDRNPFIDVDPSPTKHWIVVNRNLEDVRPKFDLAFAKRPFMELYDINSDPDNMNNLASDPKYKDIVDKLHKELFSVLEDRDDPRVTEKDDCKFDKYPYAGLADDDWYDAPANDKINNTRPTPY